MAINITVSGLTVQQQVDVDNTFDSVIKGRDDAGLTKAQWVERQLLLFIRSVVKGAKRKANEAVISNEFDQVDAEYQ